MQVNLTATALEALTAAITARQARIPSKDNEIALSFIGKNDKALRAGLVKFPSEVIERLTQAQYIDTKATDGFVAVKVNIKIVRLIAAIGQGLTATIDAYSRSIIKNLIEQQGLDTLNAYRSICTKIEVSETDIAKAVRVYHDCNPSTAMTQTSSTREMLRHLDIVQAVKRAKGDTISFKDTKQAQTLVALFA